MDRRLLFVLVSVCTVWCGEVVRPRRGSGGRWFAPPGVLSDPRHGRPWRTPGFAVPRTSTHPSSLRPPPPPTQVFPSLRPRLGILPPRSQPRNSPQVPATASVLHEVLGVLPGAISRVMKAYSQKQKTTTTEPPVIWFPNQQEDCEQDSGGGSFSAFSLLALLMSATNLAGILASNANNNLNNNNNDNNLNNNIAQESNENNANNNGNLITMITTGVGKKKRKKRGVDVVGWTNRTMWGGDDEEAVCWTQEDEVLTADEVTSVVALEFLRAYLQVGLTREGGCLLRSTCRANAAAAEWGDLAHALAQALSIAHVEWVSQAVPGVSRAALRDAADVGRSSRRASCHRRYHCPARVWATLQDDQAVMYTFMSLAGRGDETNT